MDVIDELLAKLPKLFGKIIGQSEAQQGDNNNGLRRFRDKEIVKLDRYYDYWRSRIRGAAASGELLSNGWAFSTLSGLSSFEAHIRTEPEIHGLYFNRIGGIDNTVVSINERLGGRAIGGVVLYGYGNLFRESYFVEHAKTLGILRNQRVYLVDCSIFYHIFANSLINPLRGLLSRRQIKTILGDFLENAGFKETLKDVRNDLNIMAPVIHIFFGNAFCNIDSAMLRGLLDSVVLSGDFVVGEYYAYPSGYFNDMSDQHVAQMAKIATAELFSVCPELIYAVDAPHGTNAKVTEIRVPERDGKVIVFRSMLRREFVQTELTSGPYELLSTLPALEGKIRLDVFGRLSR